MAQSIHTYLEPRTSLGGGLHGVGKGAGGIVAGCGAVGGSVTFTSGFDPDNGIDVGR